MNFLNLLHKINKNVLDLNKFDKNFEHNELQQPESASLPWPGVSRLRLFNFHRIYLGILGKNLLEFNHSNILHLKLPYVVQMRHSVYSLKTIFYLGDYIKGGGHFVLAQEQDWEVKDQSFSYNAYEAFLGDMSQMTVWNTVLSPQDIYNLAGSCKNARDDAVVISWADFVPNLRGVYKKSSKSYACDCKSKSFTTMHVIELCVVSL